MPKVSAARPERKPKLGQHFLVNDSAALRIVDAAGDLSGVTVLEIGPGRGAITSLLAKRARRLIAIETDRVLAAQLRMHFALYPNVEVIEGDILAIDFHTIFGPKPGNSRPGIEYKPAPARVVGNLPYFITSDILLRLFEYRQYFDTLILMVQKEVADRMAAEPGGSDYGLLSATTQLYSRGRKAVHASARSLLSSAESSFHGSSLDITSRLAELHVPEAGFVTFLKQSFGQKRKTLWNNLKLSYDTKVLRSALKEAGIEPTLRAEAMSLEDSAGLYRALSNSR